MASKQFAISDVGNITVSKTKKAKNLRITVKHDGAIVVSVPTWLPYSAAVEYAKSKRDWIMRHAYVREPLLSGAKIGKAHRLVFMPSDVQKPRTRVRENTVIIEYPSFLDPTSETVQLAAEKASQRALALQAEGLLPKRLRSLAQMHGFQYKSVKTRSLRSRWGSCTSAGDITLSYYLMQLTWKEIDYVLIHELAHTVYMSHNHDFWNLVNRCIPDYKETKQMLKARKPHVTV